MNITQNDMQYNYKMGNCTRMYLKRKATRMNMHEVVTQVAQVTELGIIYYLEKLCHHDYSGPHQDY